MIRPGSCNIQMVARLAGVSVGTVSRYLNNKSCKVKTCEKIEKVVAKPNYIPNPHASAITVPIGKRSCSSVLWLQT